MSKFHELNEHEKREIIFATIENLISDFLYYERKEDDSLGIDDIEVAIREKVITVEEIIECFTEHLEHNLS